MPTRAKDGTCNAICARPATSTPQARKYAAVVKSAASAAAASAAATRPVFNNTGVTAGTA